MSLSKDKYNRNRKIALELGHDIYPSYYALQTVKKQCYPDGIVVDEVCCRVGCDELILHTFSRIIESINAFVDGKNLLFEIKFGFDGCSSNSNYMLNFNNPVIPFLFALFKLL